MSGWRRMGRREYGPLAEEVARAVEQGGKLVPDVEHLQA